MIKKTFLVLNLFLIVSFWGLAKADVTASPSTAKAAGSNPGVHNSVILNLPTVAYTLSAAGTNSNQKDTNDTKKENTSITGTILPSGNPEDWTLDSIPTMISNIIKLALALAGGIAVIFILIGAFQYFTAFGNEEKATKGKTTVTYAIIGVVVILLAELIVYLVRNLIG